MARLDDLPKKKYFRVPEHYFDELPEKIQARLSPSPRPRLSPSWRLAWVFAAVPVVLIAMFLINRPTTPDAASMLMSVETADLVSYLQESHLTTEEVIDLVDLTTQELEAVESEVYDWEINDEDELLYLNLNELSDE